MWPYVFVTKKSHRSPGHLQVRKPSSMSCSHSWVHRSNCWLELPRWKFSMGFCVSWFLTHWKTKRSLEMFHAGHVFFHLHSYAPNPAFAVAKFGSHRATGVLHIWKPCRCAPPKDTFFPVGKSRLGLNSWKVETRNQQFHGTSLMFGKCWDALGKALGFQRRRNCVSHDPKPAEWMGME